MMIAVRAIDTPLSLRIGKIGGIIRPCGTYGDSVGRAKCLKESGANVIAYWKSPGPAPSNFCFSTIASQISAFIFHKTEIKMVILRC